MQEHLATIVHPSQYSYERVTDHALDGITHGCWVYIEVYSRAVLLQYTK
jgi:hypothetical protein